MLRTLSEWKVFAFEKGTSGDMVFDILKDWQEDRDCLHQSSGRQESDTDINRRILNDLQETTRKENIMKNLLLAIGLILFLAIPASAMDRWTIQPRYPDIYPNNGIMDAGSYINPYEVRDPAGQALGTMRSRYPDVEPNNGIMDRGTWQNPYDVEWD